MDDLTPHSFIPVPQIAEPLTHSMRSSANDWTVPTFRLDRKCVVLHDLTDPPRDAAEYEQKRDAAESALGTRDFRNITNSAMSRIYTTCLSMVLASEMSRSGSGQVESQDFDPPPSSSGNPGSHQGSNLGT